MRWPLEDSVAEPCQELVLPQETNDTELHPGLALLSIIALFCLSLEIELLQQIDSLRHFLTVREIASESAVALLFLLAVACCFWLFVLLIGQLAGFLLLHKRSVCVHLCWDLWIAVPLTYLVLELFEDFKLEVLPHWHAGTNVQILAAFAVSAMCIAGFFLMRWSALQQFCRTRLAPIAWVHLAIAIVAAVALRVHGVHLFHDYEHPSGAAVASKLPDIYLITVDTLRADDTSVYGYVRATTPNLEKFAQRSFTFDYFFANSNFTTPTMSSIDTGKLPWSHRIFQGGGFLRGQSQHENLAEILQQQGYYTAMISSNFLAGPFRSRTLESYDAVEYASPSHLTGFRLRETNLVGVNTQVTFGFSLIRPISSIAEYLDHTIWGYQYPAPAEDVFGRATKLIERHDGPQPMFLWSHILPPHDPYWVPPPYRHRFVSERIQNYDDLKVPDIKMRYRGVPLQQLRDAYDEMILYADNAVGDFLNWLDKTGRLDRSIVIISADHGELFDHNRLAHGGPDLYDGVIHIPLLIHLPGQTHGVRIEEVSQQADLLPTILDLIGVPIPNWSEGLSLRPLTEAKSLGNRSIFSMNLEPDRIFDPISRGTVAVIDAHFKYVRYLQAGKEQLYSYKTDPGESHNLVDSEPKVAERMRELLLNKISDINHQSDGRQ